MSVCDVRYCSHQTEKHFTAPESNCHLTVAGEQSGVFSKVEELVATKDRAKRAVTFGLRFAKWMKTNSSTKC